MFLHWDEVGQVEISEEFTSQSARLPRNPLLRDNMIISPGLQLSDVDVCIILYSMYLHTYSTLMYCNSTYYTCSTLVYYNSAYYTYSTLVYCDGTLLLYIQYISIYSVIVHNVHIVH